MIANKQSDALAVCLVQTTCRRQKIRPGQLSVHADNGSPMTGQGLAVVYGSVGCLRVDRDYVPRVPVNEEVRFQISGVVPPDELPSDEWSEGYYRVPAGLNWTTTGLTLGEALQGAQVLNVTTLLTARGDARSYLSPRLGIPAGLDGFG
jgi:hypothetical protein